MNRISQQLGQIKWFADHVQLLQSEPLKAIDALLASFPSCVISGCEVDGTTIKPGLISFVWTLEGIKHSIIVPFDGANDVNFPKYFTLQKTDMMRFYENGGSKVFSENYKAVLSDTESTPSFQILANGTTSRLLDAIQDVNHRFVTDTEKTYWNNKLNANLYTATDVLAKLLTVDGVGSGLDVDKIAGVSLSGLMEAKSAPSNDFNSIVKAGCYRLSGTLVNGPPGAVGYGQLLVVRGLSDSIAQIYFNYDGSGIWTRGGDPPEVGGSGTYRNWRAIPLYNANGYLQLGSDGPATKKKKFSGTTPSSSGFINITHGITRSKILSCSVWVQCGSVSYSLPSVNSQSYFSIGNSVISVYISETLFLSYPYTVLLEYEE